jgi:tetratricopeptide (TPR) repeat protein
VPGDYSVDDIRRVFSNSTDFNEIFDVFQAALRQHLKEVELYRLLFWNHSLTPDEIRLFGEKLSSEFPDMAYDVYLWLASVFEVTYSSSDNYELALHYYQKAAEAHPAEPDPYLDACDCYDPDLNIPPVTVLIEFVLRGTEHVVNPVSLYRRLSRLYLAAGDESRSERYRRLAEGGSPEVPPGQNFSPPPPRPEAPPPAPPA